MTTGDFGPAAAWATTSISDKAGHRASHQRPRRLPRGRRRRSGIAGPRAGHGTHLGHPVPQGDQCEPGAAGRGVRKTGRRTAGHVSRGSFRWPALPRHQGRHGRPPSSGRQPCRHLLGLRASAGSNGPDADADAAVGHQSDVFGSLTFAAVLNGVEIDPTTQLAQLNPHLEHCEDSAWATATSAADSRSC